MVTAGTIDTSFIVGTGFNDMVFTFKNQPDGKILVGGNFSDYDGTTTNYIARINPDGSFDTSFIAGSNLNDYVKSIDLLPDGRILVGGLFNYFGGNPTNYFVVLNSDGTLNQFFPSGFDSIVRKIVVQSDGKILIGGGFTNYNGYGYNYIIRLNSDFTVDNTFNIGTGFNNNVYDIEIESDGNILVGGNFTQYNGITSNNIVRLNPDGTILNTFGSGFDGRVQVITLQPDGKILVGGQFNNYNSFGSNYMIRLNKNGTVDTTFNFSYWVNDIYVQNDGRILVGGQFDYLDSYYSPYFIRLNPSGTPDGSFYNAQDISGPDFNNVNVFTELPNGNILMGGWFNYYDGENRGYIVGLNNDESTYQYQYVYSATSCDQTSVTITNKPTYYIGSNVELSNGNVVSIYDINNPSFVQCATILGDTNIAEIPTHVYTTTYDSCESCFSANTVIALVKPCSDDNGFVPPIVVSNLYNVGDIISIPNIQYNNGDDYVILFNDCFKIVEILPFIYDEYLVLPEILNYQPKQSCEQCLNCVGRYYEYQDCLDSNETGFIFSHQTMVEGNTFLLQLGTSFCKEVINTDYTYSILLSEYQTLTGSPIINSTVIYDTCIECLGQQDWLDVFQGDGAIYREGELLPNTWLFIGPDSDSCDPGWSYTKHQFPTSGSLTLNYDFTFSEDLCCDWPFYYVSPNEPIGNTNIDFSINGSSNIFGPDYETQPGTITINFNAGDWVSIGVFSTDCAEGPGVLLLENPTSQVPSDYDLHTFITCDGEEGYVNIPTNASLTPTELSIFEGPGDFDDDYFPIVLPTDFNINFLGINYDKVYVGTNSYLTFGGGSSVHNFSIPNELTNVSLPGVYISTKTLDGDCMDSVMWTLYTGLTDGGNTFIIRFEGNDDYSADLGVINLSYNFKFYKNQSNYFDLIIDKNEFFCNDDSTGGLADGNNNSWLDTFDSSPKKAYRITDTDSVMSVTEIPYTPIISYGIVKGNIGNTPAICGTVGEIVSGYTSGSVGYPGSLYFDGSTSYITIDSDYPMMDLNEGPFTVEWFQYYTNEVGCCDRVFALGNYPNEQFAFSMRLGDSIEVWVAGQVFIYSLNSPVLNTWTYFAVVGENLGGSNWILRVYQNGVQIGDSGTITLDINNFYPNPGDVDLPLTIGSQNNGNDKFHGYITNFRWTNGTCYYPNGDTFSVPTSPISVVDSQLLFLSSSEGTYIDNSSSYSLTITPSNVSWSSKNPWEVVSPSIVSYYSDATTIYESCIDCVTNYTVTLKNCKTGEITYIGMNPDIISVIQENGFIFGDLTVNCYELLDVCNISNTKVYTPIYFYVDCQDCLQPFSAGSETIICYFCDSDINNGIVKIYKGVKPHPTWTNQYGKAVVQLDMIVLGGPNGLNN